MRALWVLVALLVLLPIASAQAAPPTCTSSFFPAEDDGRPTRGSVGCRGPLDVLLTTEIVSRPAHGTLTDLEDGTWPWGSSSDLPRYTPTAGYRGPDAFTIRATVAGESVEHVVPINVVEAVDDPPACGPFNWTNRAITPGAVSLDAGETAYGNIVCGDDEGATLDIALTQGPEHGVLSALKPLGIFPGVSFTYLPELSHRGVDRFTIRASDGTHAVLTTAEINVIEPTDAAPMCLGIPYLGPTGPTFQPSVEAGKPIELTFSCGDPEGATLSFAVVTPPAHGTVVLTQPDKTIAYATYTPDVAFRGVDAFTVRMTDGPHVIDRTFKVDVVEPDPVVEQEPPVEEQPAEVRSDPPVVTAPPATVVVGTAVKPVSSPLDRRIAKACRKLKGTRKTACVKRERALARCSAMKTKTSKQRAAKRACVKPAKRP